MKTLETNTTRYRCIICGKELKGNQRKYCCPQHQQLGFKGGHASHWVDNTKEVKKLYKNFLEVNNLKDCYFGYGGRGRYIRSFIYACFQMGYNQTSIAKGIGRHPSVISKHSAKITSTDKQYGQAFLDGKLQQRIPEPTYPEGFTYGVKQ